VKLDKGRAPLLNVFVFLLRRFIVACTLMLLSKYPWAQIMILIISSLALLVYQAHVKPFIKRDDTFFEFFNEFVLLFVSYLLLALLIVSQSL
jgi:hypothetical protein